MDVQALCYTLAQVDAERLIYSLTNKLLLVKEDKVRHMPTKVECKALLDTLADKNYQMSDRQGEVRVGKLGDTSQRQI